MSYGRLYTDPRALTLTYISFIGTFGVYAVSPVLPSIVDATGVSNVQVGLVMTAGSLPAIFLLPFSAVVADLYGRRILMIPSLLLFCGAGVAIAFVDSFEAILALRLLQGVGGASIMAIVVTMIGDLYSGPAGVAVQGLRNAANGLSSLVIPIVAAFLAGMAWNYPFFLFLLGLPAVISMYYIVPETAPPDPSLEIVPALQDYVRTIKTELGNHAVANMLLGGFIQGFSYLAIITFVPLFSVDKLATSVFLAGAVLSVRGVTRILISPTTGYLLTRYPRTHVLASSLVITAIGTGLVGFSPTFLALTGFLLLFGIGDAIFTPVHRATVTEMADDDSRAGVVSVMLIYRYVGVTISPVFFGIVLSLLGFTWLFLIAGAFYFAYGVVVLWFFRPDQPVAHAVPTRV